MKRNSYLVGKSFKSYMIPAILSMTALQLNETIDGILMGHLLGANAFAAITVVQPLIIIFSVSSLLFSVGQSIRMSKYLGAMEKQRANEVFSVSVFSMLIVYFFVSVLSTLFDGAPYFTTLIGVNETLFDLSRDFVHVLMAGAIILVFQNGLSTLVDVMGNPKILTIATLCNITVNLTLDIVNIKVFGMGIEGAAVATLVGSFAAILVYATYIFKSQVVKLCIPVAFFKDLWRGMVYSLPNLVSGLTIIVLMLFVNTFIMKAQGADGMFIMAIGYNFIGIGSMVSNAVGMSYAAIGGMLLGQGDYKGMRMLAHRGTFVAVLLPICFNLLGGFSEDIAVIFGANTPELLDLASKALPLVLPTLIVMGLVYSILILHATMGYKTAAILENFALLFSLIASMAFTERFFEPENIWFAFPIGSVMGLLLLTLIILSIKLRSKESIEFYSLVPKRDLKSNIMDVSIDCDMHEEVRVLDELISFLKNNNAGKLTGSVVHCLDELMMNIVNHSGGKKGNFADLSVAVREDKIIAYLKNDGIPFDPTKVKEEDRGIGLKLAFKFSSKLEYQYAYGQNIVMVCWDKK